MKVKLLKTLAPDDIPNGSIGEVVDGSNPHDPGLHMVVFGEWVAYVYPDEVEEGP